MKKVTNVLITMNTSNLISLYFQHRLLGNSKMRNKTLKKLLFLFCLNFSSQDNLVSLVTRVLAEPLDQFGFGAECQTFSLIETLLRLAHSHMLSLLGVSQLKREADESIFMSCCD
jgi:hypothetical protein